MQNALHRYLKEVGKPLDTKVFVVIGHYDDLREYLNS